MIYHIFFSHHTLIKNQTQKNKSTRNSQDTFKLTLSKIHQLFFNSTKINVKIITYMNIENRFDLTVAVAVATRTQLGGIVTKAQDLAI